MEIRIKFRKYGNMRFVGHLDLMRYFQRALRRAGFDLTYSEGFNPHPLMSFALPLGIGLSSDGEYMDLSLNSTDPSIESISSLNSEMVEGIEVTGYVLLPDNANKAMASVAAADYIAAFKKNTDFTRDEMISCIKSYYTDRKTIPVIKKTKKSERVLDLKPLIYRLEPCLREKGGFYLRLSAGSADNIRPELVLEDFYRFFDKEYDPFNIHIHRIDLLEVSGDDFVPLDAEGTEITDRISAS